MLHQVIKLRQVWILSISRSMVFWYQFSAYHVVCDLGRWNVWPNYYGAAHWLFREAHTLVGIQDGWIRLVESDLRTEYTWGELLIFISCQRVITYCQQLLLNSIYCQSLPPNSTFPQNLPKLSTNSRGCQLRLQWTRALPRFIQTPTTTTTTMKPRACPKQARTHAQGPKRHNNDHKRLFHQPKTTRYAESAGWEFIPAPRIQAESTVRNTVDASTRKQNGEKGEGETGSRRTAPVCGLWDEEGRNRRTMCRNGQGSS